MALKGLILSPELDSIAYLECFRGLLDIKDSFHLTRVKNILGVPKLQDTKNSYLQGSYCYIYGLSKENNLRKGVYQFHT